MANDPELEARVDRLEHEVKRAREDAAAARVLAGGVDRDVDDIRQEFRQYREQNVRLHNASRADLTDLRLELRSKFDMVAAGQQQIVDLINQKFDDRGL
ncbi:hypothetical protein [Smaragdicoccus niigatensis]|uniref:hypothetical protein n=1 Tax=Smaragdicoccus niigatensis TaxID=359359 RepID=UPI00036916CB|nr:hypothetical protein [Smaragdicoccus niigatensis]